MTASAAAKRRTKDDSIHVPATFTLRPRPASAPAGCVPVDTLRAQFPPELLPEIATIAADRRIGDHALRVRLTAADLTDDEDIGEALVRERQRKAGNPSGIVTRDEAADAFQEWLARDKIVQFVRRAADDSAVTEKKSDADAKVVAFPSQRQAKIPAAVHRFRTAFPSGDLAAAAVNGPDVRLLAINSRLSAHEAAVAGALALGASAGADCLVGSCSGADLKNALAVLAGL